MSDHLLRPFLCTEMMCTPTLRKSRSLLKCRKWRPSDLPVRWSNIVNNLFSACDLAVCRILYAFVACEVHLDVKCMWSPLFCDTEIKSLSHAAIIVIYLYAARIVICFCAVKIFNYLYTAKIVNYLHAAKIVICLCAAKIFICLYVAKIINYLYNMIVFIYSLKITIGSKTIRYIYI